MKLLSHLRLEQFPVSDHPAQVNKSFFPKFGITDPHHYRRQNNELRHNDSSTTPPMGLKGCNNRLQMAGFQFRNQELGRSS